jgi:hypothetical protein
LAIFRSQEACRLANVFLWLSVWDCAPFMACSALALFFSIAGGSAISSELALWAHKGFPSHRWTPEKH